MTSEIVISPFARCTTPQCAVGCFPHASPDLVARSGKQNRPRAAALNSLKSLRKSAAGEGIRTLDPNLGKAHIAVRHAIRPLATTRSFLQSQAFSDTSC